MQSYTNWYPSTTDMLKSDGKSIFQLQLNGIEGKSIFINDSLVSIKALIQKSFNPFNEKKYELELVCEHNAVIKAGDYVKYTDEINTQENYIVITKPDVNAITKQMKVVNCVSDAVFMIGSNFKKYPCKLVSSNSMNPLDENNPFDINSEKLYMYIQNNTDVSSLTEGNRLIFGNKRAFKITGFDDYSTLGLFIITLQRDAFNPSTDKQVTIDSKQYWVANYSADPTPQPTSTEIIITPDVNYVKKTNTVGTDFTAKTYVNGVMVVDTYTFTIDSSSTAVSGQYIFTVIDSDTFNVKSNVANKKVVVKIQSVNYPLVSVLKTVNLML